MSFHQYPKYQESGVKWLNQIPSHWELKRFKQVFQERDERSVDGSQTLLSVSAYTGVSPRSEIIDDGEYLTRSESLEGYKVCYPNDLVINIMLAWNRGLGVSNYEGIVSPAYCVFKVIDDSIPAFLDYLVRTDEYTKYFKAFSSGVIDSRLRIYPDVFGSLKVGLPSRDEQICIANFLKYETEKIDTLISEQEKLIGLLKEKRQVFITNAVTKGLDPAVKMKDSGVEWMGAVPEHWRVRRLKFLATIQTGDKDTENSIEDGAYPFFVRSQTIERINSYTYDCEAILTAGDGAGVGKVFHYFNGQFDFHQRVYMLNNFKDVIGKYLFHFFKENFFKVALEGGAKSTVDSLRRPMLTNFSVSYPDIAEQENIVRVIEQKAIEFDQLILEASKTIQLLQERRSALISAAVTGQIDVSNYQLEEAA